MSYAGLCGITYHDFFCEWMWFYFSPGCAAGWNKKAKKVLIILNKVIFYNNYEGWIGK